MTCKTKDSCSTVPPSHSMFFNQSLTHTTAKRVKYLLRQKNKERDSKALADPYRKFRIIPVLKTHVKMLIFDAQIVGQRQTIWCILTLSRFCFRHVKMSCLGKSNIDLTFYLGGGGGGGGG